VLTLPLQAGQVMHELLCGRSHLRRQCGDSIVLRGSGGAQFVSATQQRASIAEERRRFSGAAPAQATVRLCLSGWTVLGPTGGLRARLSHPN
jgi:hypothetical protein